MYSYKDQKKTKKNNNNKKKTEKNISTTVSKREYISMSVIL